MGHKKSGKSGSKKDKKLVQSEPLVSEEIAEIEDQSMPEETPEVDLKPKSKQIVEDDGDDDDDSMSEDDDEHHEDKRPAKRVKKGGKEDFLDFKKILVQELGPKMRDQIKKIEDDEANDSDQEADAQSKKEKLTSNKRDEVNSIKQEIEAIHEQMPELEPELIEELLKYDDNVIFVGNVPSYLEKRKITQIFRQFGAIRSIRVRGYPGKKHIEKKLNGIKYASAEIRLAFID
jgi:hypothetical protein